MDAVAEESKCSSPKYEHWGGLAAIVGSLPDVAEALAADAKLAALFRKLDSIDNAPSTFTGKCEALKACDFSTEDVNRLNSPTLDAWFRLSQRYFGRLNGNVPHERLFKRVSEPQTIMLLEAILDAIELRADLSMVKLLLSFDVDISPFGFQYVDIACRAGKLDTLEFLLDLLKVDVNDRARRQRFASADSLKMHDEVRLLTVAAGYGHKPLVVSLLKRGAQQSAFCFDAVRYAAKYNRMEVVDLLLEEAHRLPPQEEANWHDVEDSVPLLARKQALAGALMGGHAILVRHLLNCGLTVDELSWPGKSLLTFAVSGNASIDMVRLLLDCGASVNGIATEATPLATVAQRLDDVVNIATLLVERGARLDGAAVSVLRMHAGRPGMTELMESMFEKGLHLSPEDAYRIAVRSDAPSLLRLLLRGLHVDYVPHDPAHAAPLLHHFVHQGNVDAVNLLVAHRVNLYRRNQAGRVAFEYRPKRNAQLEHSVGLCIAIIEKAIAETPPDPNDKELHVVKPQPPDDPEMARRRRIHYPLSLFAAPSGLGASTRKQALS